MPRTTRWSEVHAELRRRILTVRVSAGTPLSEAALAAEFGTSTTPVRDALGRLSVEGLVEVGPGRGYTVAPLRISDLRELSDVRFVLERGTCELLVASGASLDPARTANQRLTDGPDDEVVDGNIEFHVTLARSAGNELLATMVRQVLERSARFLRLGLQRISGAQIHDSHELLLAALAMPDLARATALLRAEVFSTRDRVAGLLGVGTTG